MRPFCHITANGTDITAKISDYLLSIEITDEADDKSDSVTLTLDDRPRFADGAWIEIPLIGTVLGITLGYREGASRFMGSYLIDEITVKPTPRTLEITGRAADMNKAYRTPRSGSYHQKTLGAIIGEIAGRNGYQPKLDPSLGRIVIRHIDQHNESDMAFTTRLAGLHDGVAKPVDGKLVLAKRGTGKAITGEELPVVRLNPSQCADWNFKYSARDEAGEAAGITGSGEDDQHAAADAGDAPSFTSNKQEDNNKEQKGGVRAFYHDIRSGEKKEVTVGQEPFHDLRYSWHNEAEAKAAISSYQNRSMRGKASLSADMGGNPFILAEARLIMTPPFRPYIPNEWRIKQVKHKLDVSGGYTTSIDCELFDEKQQDTVANIKQTTPATDDMIDEQAPPRAVEDTPTDAPTDDRGVIHLPNP